MAETLQLEIISPSGVVYTGDVTHVQAPGQTGYFGVLPNHTPMISALTIGRITAETANGEALFATSGGVAEVHGDKVVILAETAEEKSKIDLSRAQEAQKRAETRLDKQEEGTDFDRARLALMRAINRMSVVNG